jgi:hypothetical protein
MYLAFTESHTKEWFKTLCDTLKLDLNGFKWYVAPPTHTLDNLHSRGCRTSVKLPSNQVPPSQAHLSYK